MTRPWFRIENTGGQLLLEGRVTADLEAVEIRQHIQDIELELISARALAAWLVKATRYLQPNDTQETSPSNVYYLTPDKEQ